MSVAVVLEQKGKISIREIDLEQQLGPLDARIEIDTVGICGSDVHYYTHGKIGHFVVEEPMVLGHEAAGRVIDVGPDVTTLKVGDKVCMEPGIPDLNSRASKLGLYNVDPSVTFWATPPIHGCLTPTIVHPAAFTYKLPDNVSMAQGAMVEPLAIGVQAAAKAQIRPGDIAFVTGAGPIGIMTALAALAGGCSKVILSDIVDEKLDVAVHYDGIETINVTKEKPLERINKITDSWGVDIVFECAGAVNAYTSALEVVRPGGCLVLVGMPVDPIPFDVVAAQAKEIRIETVFRYANVYDRAINLIASGKIDLMPLISKTFDFHDSVEAFDRAVEARATDIKLQIKLPGIQ